MTMFADSSTAQIVGIGVGGITVGSAFAWCIVQITPAIKERITRKPMETSKPAESNGGNGESGKKPVSFWDAKFERLENKMENKFEAQDRTLNRMCECLETSNQTQIRMCEILESQRRRQETEDALLRTRA